MNYEQYVGPLLVAFGAGLQWLRQWRKFTDEWTYLLATVLALSAYGLTHVPSSDWRLEGILAILFVSTNLATVLGGTFMAAQAAYKGVPLVPQTNSRGAPPAEEPK